MVDAETKILMTAIPPKPVTDTIRPEITFLPSLTRGRRIFRDFIRGFFRLVLRIVARIQVSGLENIPAEGPALIVANHLGDADWVVGIAFSKRHADTFVKAELHDFPVLGKVLDAYGVIWVHRGQPDRRAIRAALDGFKEGRLISIAPEGRESLTGALEEGTGGAAYLAYKAKVPIVPVTFTGTENKLVLSNLKQLHRTQITLTIGAPFNLDDYPSRHEAIDHGTHKIMRMLAAQLPIEYQGVYQGIGKGRGDHNGVKNLSE